MSGGTSFGTATSPPGNPFQNIHASLHQLTTLRRPRDTRLAAVPGHEGRPSCCAQCPTKLGGLPLEGGHVFGAHAVILKCHRRLAREETQGHASRNQTRPCAARHLHDIGRTQRRRPTVGTSDRRGTRIAERDGALRIG